MNLKIVEGDVFNAFAREPNNSVDLVLTSPPYWGLRSYGVEGELGAEPTLEAYLDNTMRWVKEAWRVLKPTGSLVLNLGGSYCGSGTKDQTIIPRGEPHSNLVRGVRTPTPPGKMYKTKQFLDVGAFAYQRIITETDFVCRNRAVWCKPNVPSPIRSRLKQSTESIDWFVKDADEYYFNPKPWMKATSELTKERNNYSISLREQTRVQRDISVEEMRKRPKETIEHSWRVIPVGEKQKGFELSGKEKQEHVAPFPEALIKPWVVSLCPARVCENCGKPVTIKRVLTKHTPSKGGTLGLVGGNRVRERIGRDCDYYVPAEYETTESPSCSCGVGFTAGTVLDPFLGSGTTLKVARDLHLNGVGYDLNPQYAGYARKRLNWGEVLSGYKYEEAEA